jgi:hypothetical protein
MLCKHYSLEPREASYFLKELSIFFLNLFNDLTTMNINLFK